jgi:glycosyltransferase involved in cell wall biosynthesis
MSSFVDKIDVRILTWNSGSTLDRCLKSIVREIPVNSIRILDNFSTDDTIKIARKYEARITQKKCGIGEARQYLIGTVTTEYFAFIDSDIVLRKGWFEAVLEKIESDKNIGAACGLWFSDNPQDRHFWEIWFQRMRADDPMWERGAALNNSLFRTKSIKGISIPKWMTNYEDRYIRNYLVSRGYRWVVERKAACDHLVGESSFWKACLNRKYLGAVLKLWKDVDPNVSMKKFLAEALREPAVSSYAAIKAKDPLVIPFRLLTSFFRILGYVGSSSKVLRKFESDADYGTRANKWKRIEKDRF